MKRFVAGADVFLYVRRLENPAWPSVPHGLPERWFIPIFYFLAIVAVPAGLLIVGWVCLWIGRGFRGR
jgi:hypothetical protein